MALGFGKPENKIPLPEVSSSIELYSVGIMLHPSNFMSNPLKIFILLPGMLS